MLSGWVLLLAPGPWPLAPAIAQQPQAQQGQPIVALNAKYVNGVAPGYWPTSGTGLALNLSAGTSVCGNLQVTYAGGTLTLAANATNYVYLDSTNDCVPALATGASGFPPTGIPLAVVTTNGSAITGLSDARTWFAARPVVDMGGQVFNVKAFGATGNGTTDDTSAILAAVNAAKTAAQGGVIFFPATCNCYKTSSPLPLVSSLAYEGEVVSSAGGCAAKIMNTASDVFNLTAAVNSARVEHLNISAAGSTSGHVFNLSGYGVGGTTWNDLNLGVGNPAKSVFYSVCQGTSDCSVSGATTFLANNVIENSWIWYGANTAPVFYFQNATINTDTFSNLWFTGNGSSQNYAMWFAGTATPYVNLSMDHIVFEVCNGGAIEFQGANGVVVSNSGVYDTGQAVNPQVNIAANTVGGSGNGSVTFINDGFATSTSASYPDLYIGADFSSVNLYDSSINFASAANSSSIITTYGAGNIGHPSSVTMVNYGSSFKNGTIVNPASVYGLQTTAVSQPQAVTPTDVSASNTWAASTFYCWSYSATQAVIFDGTRFEYATTCGNSGTTTPTWPTTAGSTVTDGSVTWTCLGTSAFTANTTYYFKVAGTAATGNTAANSEVSVTTANDGKSHMLLYSHSSYNMWTGQTGYIPGCSTASGSETATAAPYTGAYTGLSNYIFPLVACGGSGAMPTVDTSGSISTPGNGIVGVHLNQTGANKFAGQCAMASASTCAFSLSAAYNGTPLCITTPQGTSATYYGACSVSGTTVTITASGSNSLTWGAMLVGNPN